MKIKSKDDQQILANNLAFYRKNAKLTQLDLAEKFNYSDKAISKWEKGESAPSVFVLRALADFYGITLEDFFNETPKKPFFNKTRKHILITIISMMLVWLVAAVLFTLFTYAFEATSIDTITWYIWVLGVPVCAILAIIFSNLWGNILLVCISTAILVWTVAVCIYIPVDYFTNLTYDWLLFIIPIPLTIIIGLWYFLKAGKLKINKEPSVKKVETSSLEEDINNQD